MNNPIRVSALEQECRALFTELASLQDKIRVKLNAYADGKTLKGNELVGWLGEIYGKLLLDGKLVHDREEHDFVCADGSRVSVKTRKGFGTGWQRTSAIPKPDFNTYHLAASSRGAHQGFSRFYGASQNTSIQSRGQSGSACFGPGTGSDLVRTVGVGGRPRQTRRTVFTQGRPTAANCTLASRDHC